VWLWPNVLGGKEVPAADVGDEVGGDGLASPQDADRAGPFEDQRGDVVVTVNACQAQLLAYLTFGDLDLA
jgi:hypothetical protein